MSKGDGLLVQPVDALPRLPRTDDEAQAGAQAPQAVEPVRHVADQRLVHFGQHGMQQAARGGAVAEHQPLHDVVTQEPVEAT
jgi:hypothetical protein